MQKISWIKRLFMSWASLERYFNHDWEAKSKDWEIKAAKLETQAIGQEATLAQLQARVDEKQRTLEAAQASITSLSDEVKKLQIEKENLALNNNNNISRTREELQIITEQARNLKAERNSLQTNIADKLKTIEKIEKTFFGITGSKGKGELGEMQLETILRQSGIDESMWTQNFNVGNGKYVEFAISSGDGHKWIPVDSKVLETDFDDEGKAIVDEKYRDRVKVQVKKVYEYINQKNTTSHGLLVLQNDEIYLKLFEAFPTFFEEMIREHQIYICSRSSFVQFAWSVAHILDIYKQVHQDKKIYDEIQALLVTINKFAHSLISTHKSFNIAMNTHYITLQGRSNKLSKKLIKNSKWKELPAWEQNGIITDNSDDEELD